NNQQNVWDQDFEDFRLNIKRNSDLNIAVGPNQTPQDVIEAFTKGYSQEYINSETQKYPPQLYFGPNAMVLHEQNFKFENADGTPNLNPTNSASGPRQRFIIPLVETEGPPPPPPPPPPKDTTTKPQARKPRNKINPPASASHKYEGVRARQAAREAARKAKTEANMSVRKHQARSVPTS
ncbi:unnamed protein product, partial [Sphagnum compactum]